MAAKLKQKKAHDSAPESPPGDVTGPAPELTVAYDQERFREYLVGNLTLGELEGVGKDIQYQIAERGYKLLNEGKLDDAEHVYRGLVSLDPFDSYFHTVLGSVYQRQDRRQDAVDAYTRALRINPYNATALANRGEVHFHEGRILEATQDIQAALECDPDCSEPATLRCRVLAMALARTIEENREQILASMSKGKAGKGKTGKNKTGKKKSGKKKKSESKPKAQA